MLTARQLEGLTERVAEYERKMPPYSLFGDDNDGAYRALRTAIKSVQATPNNSLAATMFISFGRCLNGEITTDEFIKLYCP